MKKRTNYRKSYKQKISKPFYQKNAFKKVSFCVFAFALIFYFIVLFDYFWINEIEITGNEKVSLEELLVLTENNIEKDFKFFSSKSIFLIKRNELIDKKIDQYPEISFVEITKEYPNKIKISIKENKEVAFWCGSKQKDSCFLINGNGFIFKEKEEERNLIKLINNKNPEIRGQVFSEQEMAFIKKIWDNLGIKIKIKEIEFNGPNVTVRTGDNAEIFFTLTDDVVTQIEKINLILIEKIDLNELNLIEYIDLRFNRSLYYKYK